MATLLGTIRNYSCRYVETKRQNVSIITNQDVIMSVPVLHRSSNQVSNAVLAFACPWHAGAALAAECEVQTPRAASAAVYSVRLDVLHEFTRELQIPTVVITGARCDLPFGAGNGRGEVVYELVYLHPPSPAKKTKAGA